MKVREYRIIKGFTQSEIAKLLGIKQNTYSYKERGIYDFSVKEIKVLKKILEVNYDQLFEEDNIN